MKDYKKPKEFKVMPGAEPFHMEGGRVGLLLLHGFTSTPQELRTTGEYFAEKGFTIYCPRLSGHGTLRRDLKKRKFHEWIRDAQEGYNFLNKKCDKIFILGSSYGGVLSLYTAAHNRVEGVITVGSPFRIHLPKWAVNLFYPVVKLFANYILKPKVGDMKDRNALKRRVANHFIPVKAFGQVWEHIKITEKMLKDFETPILILQSKRDHAVHPKSARIIYDNVASTIKELRYFRDSYHLIMDDYEKVAALEFVDNFIMRVLNSKKVKNEIRHASSY